MNNQTKKNWIDFNSIGDFLYEKAQKDELTLLWSAIEAKDIYMHRLTNDDLALTDYSNPAPITRAINRLIGTTCDWVFKTILTKDIKQGFKFTLNNHKDTKWSDGHNEEILKAYQTISDWCLSVNPKKIEITPQLVDSLALIFAIRSYKKPETIAEKFPGKLCEDRKVAKFKKYFPAISIGLKIGLERLFELKRFASNLDSSTFRGELIHEHDRGKIYIDYHTDNSIFEVKFTSSLGIRSKMIGIINALIQLNELREKGFNRAHYANLNNGLVYSIYDEYLDDPIRDALKKLFIEYLDWKDKVIEESKLAS